MTDSSGAYEFGDVSPGGTYNTIEEEMPDLYHTDVSDQDNIGDGGSADNYTDVDNQANRR